jgi:catechol 2,3-dioxygenase-like lactoylglutathione lyase family enzyme
VDTDATGALLHTVIIDSPDIRRLAAFYGQGLELGEATPTGDDHLGFSLPNLYLGFDLVLEGDKPDPGPVSLWFEVSDLDATFDRFGAMGAEVEYPPARKPWGAVLAAVLDPDGNTVGLAQRGTIPE